MAIIEVSGLKKSYRGKQVLHGVDLHVDVGEIVGILGPNGAGKTTTVECIGGLRRADAGRILVAGIDPAGDDPRLRHLLGMQLQQCRLPARITTAEAIELFAACYPNPRGTDELLGRFNLTEQRNQRFEKLSGGQQQRLSVALALVGRPQIAILDELTTGLDPAARRDVWNHLADLSADGTTIVLVTHSMAEAQRLCDRIYLIDTGRVIAEGTPAELAESAGDQTIAFIPSAPVELAGLAGLPGVSKVDRDGDRIIVQGAANVPQALLTLLSERGITAGQLRITGPSLDDAYLHLTQPTRTGIIESAPQEEQI